MKRLIVFSATGFLLVVTIALLIRAHPGASPAQAQDPPPMPTTAAQLAQAAQLKDQKKWEDALTILRQVATRRAEDEAAAAQAQLRLGQYLLQMALPAQAELELRRVLVDFPNDRDAVDAARLFLSDALAFQGQNDLATQEARSLAEDASAVLVLRGWAFVRWAGLLRRDGQLDEAVTVLDQLSTLPWPLADKGPQIEGGILQARILVDRQHFGPAAEALEQVITFATADAYAQQRNWARVFLAEVLLNLSAHSRVRQVTDDIIADHAARKADDLQAVWALILKSRSRMFTNETSAVVGALEPARMAAVLAIESGRADLAFEANLVLGEVYSRLSRDADRLVRQGDGAYAASPVAAVVDETRRAQNYVHEGEWGPLMVQAMDHYRTAMNLAEQFNAGPDRRDKARLEYAACIRHLGMRDKAVAVLRLGIPDPAQMTDTGNKLAQAIGLFLDAHKAEAWYAYLGDPLSHPDPTAAIVEAEFGTTASLPSGEPITNQFERWLWLGRFYQNQKRWEQAATMYEQALGASRRTYDRALAQDGIACCRYGLAIETSDADLRRRRKLSAILTATRAVTEWNAVVLEVKGDKTHWPIERAIDILWDTAQYQEATDLAEHLAYRVDPVTDPRQAAFALMKLSEVYLGRSCWEQAANAARAVWDRFADTNDAVVQEICIHAMFIAELAFANLGDFESARSVLDTLEHKWPEKLAHAISQKRASLAGLEEGQG